MIMKRKLVGIAGTAALGLALAGLNAVPAQAGATHVDICNSSASVEVIKVYNVDWYGWPNTFLWPNQCTNTGIYGIEGFRVDVDTTSDQPDLGVDVDSYKIGHIGHGYGPCHVGETDSSNPPDDYVDGIRYRNYTNSSCS